MKSYDITKLVEREKTWKEKGKQEWLLKHGTTFANVNEEL